MNIHSLDDLVKLIEDGFEVEYDHERTVNPTSYIYGEKRNNPNNNNSNNGNDHNHTKDHRDNNDNNDNNNSAPNPPHHNPLVN